MVARTFGKLPLQPNVSDFRYAIIGPNVDVSGCDLKSFNFTNIDLSGVNLNNVKTYDLIANGSETLPLNYNWILQPNLSGTKYAIVGPGINLSEADLTGADLSDCQHGGINLTAAILNNIYSMD